MKKLTIKKIIEFRGKTDKAKKKFATDLKANKAEPKPKSGGDYWQIAVSAIAKAYKQKDLQIITDKIKEFEEKMPGVKHPATRIQYKANIELLNKYENFDFKKWTPNQKIRTEKNHKTVLTTRDLLVESAPQHVYSFGKKDDQNEIGGIWFIAKKDGYKIEEMGMFADILSRYLKSQYGKDYTLNPRYCIAVDLVGNYNVNYSQLQSGEVSPLLNKTIDEIKKLM